MGAQSIPNAASPLAPEDPFPDDSILLSIEQAACELIQVAGKLVTERRADLAVEYKSGNKSDPVTQVDRAVEAFLTDSVSARFPQHAVLGEEGQDPQGAHEFEWIVDPVDGTLNYITGLPMYAISVGVLHRRRPVVGVILFPVTSDMFWARHGGGAHRNGDRLRVRQQEQGSRTLLAGLPGSYRTAFKADRKFRASLGDTRSLGSIAYEMAVVAAGSLDLALFRGPRIWDVAGGVPIVTEAGGNALIYSRRRGSWQPLERFAAPRRGGLRAWRQPVMIGSATAMDALSPHIRPRYAPALLVAAAQAYRAARRGYWTARAER